MEGDELRKGKERVRQILIEPLQQRGMVRKRGQKVEQVDRMLASLEARLAYMTADNLGALAEVVERYAEGPKKNVWPAEVSICNWARRLQLPPASESRLVRSYLQSVAGRRAQSEGYLVELFYYLKKWGAPPAGDWAIGKIKAEAEDNQQRRANIERLRDEGRASPSDLQWLSRYWAALERCTAIITAGAEGAAA